jgi:hypothetical protein
MRKTPRYPFDTRLGGPQCGSGIGGEEKIFDPTRTRNSTYSVVKSAGSLCTDCAIPASYCTWEVIKMDLKGTVCKDFDWILLAHD